MNRTKPKIVINIEGDLSLNAMFVNYDTLYESNECLFNGYKDDFLSLNA